MSERAKKGQADEVKAVVITHACAVRGTAHKVDTKLVVGKDISSADAKTLVKMDRAEVAG